MMLYMSPDDVDMSKAVKDYHPGKGLTRDPTKKDMTYSASGVYGDATLATKEKGRIVTEALVTRTLREIEDLRGAPLPAAAPLVPSPPVR